MLFSNFLKSLVLLLSTVCMVSAASAVANTQLYATRAKANVIVSIAVTFKMSQAYMDALFMGSNYVAKAAGTTLLDAAQMTQFIAQRQIDTTFKINSGFATLVLKVIYNNCPQKDQFRMQAFADRVANMLGVAVLKGIEVTNSNILNLPKNFQDKQPLVIGRNETVTQTSHLYARAGSCSLEYGGKFGLANPYQPLTLTDSHIDDLCYYYTGSDYHMCHQSWPPADCTYD